MLPQFPDFKLLEYTDKIDIEHLLQGFPVYSDFNFTSLHVWNVQSEMQISRLHENLVVRFSDYITGDPFLSFLGANEPRQTAARLIEYSKTKYGLPSLRLIPGTVAIQLPETDFFIVEDADAFDYVYPLSFFKSLSEQPSKCKPTAQLRAFLKLYPHHSVSTSALGEANTVELKRVFEKWAYNKGMNYRSLHEFSAFTRLLECENENIYITVIAVSDVQVGFIINEILDRENAICHFYKADVLYKGVYESVLWEAAKMLHERGIQHLNFEQDLGIEALRRSKGKYKRHSFLKKYIVSLKAGI